jgi:hypothetical protein
MADNDQDLPKEHTMVIDISKSKLSTATYNNNTGKNMVNIIVEELGPKNIDRIIGSLTPANKTKLVDSIIKTRINTIVRRRISRRPILLLSGGTIATLMKNLDSDSFRDAKRVRLSNLDDLLEKFDLSLKEGEIQPVDKTYDDDLLYIGARVIKNIIDDMRIYYKKENKVVEIYFINQPTWVQGYILKSKKL